MRHFMLIISILIFLTGCHVDSTEQIDMILNELSIPLHVEDNFILLPETYLDINLSWESSNTQVIDTSGEVSRVFIDTPVTLTAFYIFEDIEKSKTFIVTVKGSPLTASEIVDLDYEELQIPLVTSTDLILPKSGSNGSVITWKTSSAYIISKSGIYYSPIDEEIVTLEATFLYLDAVKLKTFEVIALAMPDLEKVEKDYVMLEINDETPKNNILLPIRGYFTSSITWESSNIEIIDHQGTYYRPIGNHNVTLTATIQKGDFKMNKTFDIAVEGYDIEAFRQELRDKLVIHHGIEIIFGDVQLPNKVLDIADVSWHSSHPNILSETGAFHYPNETTTLTLTAYVTSNTFEDELTFSYTVYGKNDTSSELDHQQLSSVSIDHQQLFYHDHHEKLTLGTFENLIYKDHGLIITGGLTEGSYTSPAIQSDQYIQRLNLMWGSITHENAKTEFFTRYQTSEGWSAWYSHGTWGYGGNNLPPQITRNISEQTNAIQYKVILSRSNENMPSPQLNFVSIQFITNQNINYSMDDLNPSVLYTVPQLKQADTLDAFLWNNICWATSISMMLQYYQKLLDLDVPQEYYSVLIRQGTERFGTTKNDIGATQFGVTLHELEFHSAEMLLHVIDHYGPVIVGVSKGNSPDGKFGPLTYSSGHVVVVVGYEIKDDGKIDIIVNDPAVSWMRFTIKGSLEEFMLVWDHGGMLMQND